MKVNPFSNRTTFWAVLTGAAFAATQLAQSYPDPRVQALGAVLQPFFIAGGGTMTAMRMRDGVAASGPVVGKKK